MLYMSVKSSAAQVMLYAFSAAKLRFFSFYGNIISRHLWLKVLIVMLFFLFSVCRVAILRIKR